MVRGKVDIEEDKRGRENIIITEIPYQVNKAVFISRIAELVNSKVIEGISEIRDESDRNGMRIVIGIKKDANTSIIINQLYKHTALQTSFGVILLALVDNVPRVLNLKGIIIELYQSPKRGDNSENKVRTEEGRGKGPYPGRPENRPG